MKSTFSDYYLSEAKFKLIELNQDARDREDSDQDEPEEDIDNEHGIKDITDEVGNHNREEHTDEDEKEPEDPDRQGLIRTVPGAHLIYKRASRDGMYSEMWMYEIGSNHRSEEKVRSAILDGTDIDQRLGASVNGEQTYELWTCNDRQIMKISGLPN
jgi:hypothetical protein